MIRRQVTWSLSVAAAVVASTAATPAGAATAPPAGTASSHRLLLTAAQMLRLSELAQQTGDLVTASAIYAALETNPDAEIRAEARFRHARQLLQQKRNSDAALLLRRLLDEKPAAVPARLELARALELLGDAGAALREVRAVQSAGLPPAVARLVDRYSQALRASRPLGASFEIALAPDSNINRATRSDTLGTIFGDFDISQESKARSGTGLSLRAQAFRRIALSDNISLLGRLSGSGDLYRKMQFNDVAIDFAAGPQFRVGRNQLDLELGATQRWYGQKPFIRSVRLGGSWIRPVGDRMQIRVSGSAALINSSFNDLQDGKAYSARIDAERALSPTTGVGANLSFDRQSLRDAGYSATGWRAGMIGWRELGRMTLTAEASYGRLEGDERLLLFPTKRADRFSRLSVGATFRQLTFHGFSPVTRVTFERNRSSIEFYDYRKIRSEVGIARAF